MVGWGIDILIGGMYMGKKIDEMGILRARSMRRMGASLKEVAAFLRISQRELVKVAEGDVDNELAGYMMEDAVFKKAVAGDLKACEFWLKHWGKKGCEGAVDMGKIEEKYDALVEKLGL